MNANDLLKHRLSRTFGDFGRTPPRVLFIKAVDRRDTQTIGFNFDAPSNVAGYTRKDGVTVKPHSAMRKHASKSKKPKFSLENFVKVAADSIEKLRKIDVERVLDSPAADKGKLADYIIKNRPDLKDEVVEVMAELSPKWRHEDVVTEPRGKMIAEHERLVDVLRSPSHADDKIEAKKQAAELAEMKAGERKKPLPKEIEADRLREMGSVRITDVGAENIYFEKGGKYYYSKVGNTEKYGVGWYNFDSPSERGEKFSVPSNGVAASNADGAGNKVAEAVRPRKYYVTMKRDGVDKTAWLAGPYDTHEEALSHVEEARKHAYDVDPRSAFDAFGTASYEAEEGKHHPGVLNERMGIGAQKKAA